MREIEDHTAEDRVPRGTGGSLSQVGNRGHARAAQAACGEEQDYAEQRHPDGIVPIEKGEVPAILTSELLGISP